MPRIAVGLLVWTLAAAVCWSAPVPGLTDVVPSAGPIHDQERAGHQVRSLSYLLRDCRRCHGHGMTRAQTILFDPLGRLKIDLLRTAERRAYLARWSRVALDSSASQFRPDTPDGRRDVAAAIAWLERKEP